MLYDNSLIYQNFHLNFESLFKLIVLQYNIKSDSEPDDDLLPLNLQLDQLQFKNNNPITDIPPQETDKTKEKPQSIDSKKEKQHEQILKRQNTQSISLTNFPKEDKKIQIFPQKRVIIGSHERERPKSQEIQKPQRFQNFMTFQHKNLEDPQMVELDSLMDLKKKIQYQINNIQHTNDDQRMHQRFDKTKQYILQKVIKSTRFFDDVEQQKNERNKQQPYMIMGGNLEKQFIQSKKELELYKEFLQYNQ